MYYILWILWFLFHGKVTLEILGFGLLICNGVYWLMCRYMDYDAKKDLKLIVKLPLYIKYAFVLVKEVIKSNLAVMRIILSPSLEAEPGFASFETDLETEVARVMLANSMTLTPGTYTVALEENRYVIHALDMAFTENIAESVFVKQLRRLEDKA